jgi:hypothetical protein
VDLEAAAAYEKLMFGVARRVADREQRPRWKPESFFRQYARR